MYVCDLALNCCVSVHVYYTSIKTGHVTFKE